jgi:hypothetical protein
MTREHCVTNCSSQKPLLITGIRTQDIWFLSLDLRPLDDEKTTTRDY